MKTKHNIEIFGAGCPVCKKAADLVSSIVCPSCEVSVLDMHDTGIAYRAKEIGIRLVPTVVIDGKIADCCTGKGIDEEKLREAILG